MQNWFLNIDMNLHRYYSLDDLRQAIEEKRAEQRRLYNIDMTDEDLMRLYHTTDVEKIEDELESEIEILKLEYEARK